MLGTCWSKWDALPAHNERSAGLAEHGSSPRNRTTTADVVRTMIWLWRLVGLRRLLALFMLRKVWRTYQARSTRPR